MSPRIFDTSQLKWRTAKKTKGLKAKPISSLIVDKSVLSKFLIDTLEGKEPIQAGAIFCIGEHGDAWPQSAKKLLIKYDIVDIDEDGWMVCVPKPDNSVEFYEAQPDDIMPYDSEPLYIVSLWGETIDGVKNLQSFSPGDFIVRNPKDASDKWIVRRNIWMNSYTEVIV